MAPDTPVEPKSLVLADNGGDLKVTTRLEQRSLGGRARRRGVGGERPASADRGGCRASKVSRVAHETIAALCVQSLEYAACLPSG